MGDDGSGGIGDCMVSDGDTMPGGTGLDMTVSVYVRMRV